MWSRRPLSEDFLAGLVDEISYRCNLDLDLGEFTRRFRDDPLLGPARPADPALTAFAPLPAKFI